MKSSYVTKFKRAQYNCAKAQRLSIKRQETKLTPTEYLHYKIHMRYCSLCREFEKFSALLNQFFSGKQRGIPELPMHHLSLEEKEEMQRKIDDLSNHLKK